MGEKTKKLQSYLKELYKGKKTVDVNITESFRKNGEHEYALHKLGLDMEKGMALFYDVEDIVRWEDTSVLNGFLVSSIINDPEIIDSEINIVFKDGNINIKVVG